MRPIMGYQGPLPMNLGYISTPFNAGGNNGGSNGLATTVNSLPPQIESLSSALQNINELANQLTGGIGALMGSLQGNENAPGLAGPNYLGGPQQATPGDPNAIHYNQFNPPPANSGLLPYRPNVPLGGGILGLQQGGTNALGQNPLQRQLGRIT